MSDEKPITINVEIDAIAIAKYAPEKGVLYARPRTLKDALLPEGATPEQLEALRDIKAVGFDIIIHPDGAVELRR